MRSPSRRLVLIHADESCLGNGTDGKNPGGAGSLLETRHRNEIVRRDLYISSPDTTNNRMALLGAIETLSALTKKKDGLRVRYVSDSQYLIKGMTEWIAGWRARGWRRKGGQIENLAMWRELDGLSSSITVEWKWVRGHSGNPKNEYADALAVRAASDQLQSGGLVESGLVSWLANKQAAGQFINYDPDGEFMESI